MTENKEEEQETELTELESAFRERDELKANNLRLLAEMENARKRMQKEHESLRKIAVENVIADFLQPLDQMQKALSFVDNMSPEVKNWAVGFQMILTQFMDTLAENNVRPFESLHEPFDPHKHEAVEMVETDSHPPGIIIEECLRGYCMGERIVRPARVKVSQSPTVEDVEEIEIKEKDPEEEKIGDKQ